MNALLTLKSLDGARMNVVREGKGPAVVAIHGFTGSVSTWDVLQSAIGRRFTLVRVELLGHGSSDSPDDPELYSMGHTVNALGEILDQLKLDKVHWLGYSMGGRVALSAAILLKGRTRSLIAESASPGLALAEERQARIKSDEALAEWMEQAGIEAFVDRWQKLPLWASQRRLLTGQKLALRRQRLACNVHGLANSLRGIGTGAQPAMHGRMSGLRCPALFIAGEEDARFAAIAGEMAASAPDARLSVVKEAGHAVHMEQQDSFNKCVLDFLEDVEHPQDASTRAAGRQNL